LPIHAISGDDTTLYAGIDGGGTKTLAVIVDALGRERGRGTAAGANFMSAGLDETVANVQCALDSASSMAGSVRLTRAWIGLAGADRAPDFAALRPCLQHVAQEVRLTNDAALVLCGLEHTIGVALVAGTGSIAVGCDAHGTSARAGGWGHVLGDEGGGYAIGRAGLRAVMRAADGRGPKTALIDRVLRRFQLRSPEQLVAAIYADPTSSLIAGLAPSILEAARDGDAVAVAIVRHAAEDLALAVLTVAANLALPERLPLALAGSLLTRETGYRELVLESIRGHRELGQIALVDCPAATAARAARQPLDPQAAAPQTPQE
jgi:glucosamine kinase